MLKVPLNSEQQRKVSISSAEDEDFDQLSIIPPYSRTYRHHRLAEAYDS